MDSLSAPSIREIYEALRLSYAIGPGSEAFETLIPFRMTLGFEKAVAFVQFADIRAGDRVLNIFSGPGGLLKLCMLSQCSGIVGLDNRYANSTSSWKYDVESAMREWRQALEPLQVPTSCDPSFVAEDVRAPRQILKFEKFDRILIDPPFGDVSNLALGQDSSACIHLVDLALELSADLVERQGSVALCCPVEFLPGMRMPQRLTISEQSILGGSKDIVMLRMVPR